MEELGSVCVIANGPQSLPEKLIWGLGPPGSKACEPTECLREDGGPCRGSGKCEDSEVEVPQLGRG